MTEDQQVEMNNRKGSLDKTKLVTSIEAPTYAAEGLALRLSARGPVGDFRHGADAEIIGAQVAEWTTHRATSVPKHSVQVLLALGRLAGKPRMLWERDALLRSFNPTDQTRYSSSSTTYNLIRSYKFIIFQFNYIN